VRRLGVIPVGRWGLVEEVGFWRGGQGGGVFSDAEFLVDFRGAEGGIVQQGHGDKGLGGCEVEGDGGVDLLDGVEKVGGEVMPVPGEEQVGFVEAAAWGAGGPVIGLAPGCVAIRRVRRYGAQRAGDILEVVLDELGEETVEVDEEAADEVGGDPDGQGEAGQRHGVPAVDGEEGAGGFEDEVFAVEFARGEDGAEARDVGCGGAEEAGCGVHGGEYRERTGNVSRKIVPIKKSRGLGDGSSPNFLLW
jgi:hypothetical protein